MNVHRPGQRAAARRGWLPCVAAIGRLAACAGARARLERPASDADLAGASARELAQAGLAAYVARSDPAAAAPRVEAALRRDPRDPWARLGAALLARRSLDDAAEVKHLSALVAVAPGHPLAAPAARRLGELAELAPPLAQAVESGLAVVEGRVAGLTAARVRWARAAAASSLGDQRRAEALRAENGAVTAWTLAGPFGALHALELDRRFAPEEGALPAEVPTAVGLPPAPTRALPCPEGLATLEGEPGGDIFYLAADAALARGGDYLLVVGSTVGLRAFLDGAPVAERRAYAGYVPLAQVVPVRLGRGRHRLLVKLGRGGDRAQLAVSLARADGAPSDASFSPVAPGAPGPAVRGGPAPAPLEPWADLVPRLEREAPPEVARLIAARDAMDVDRETAKALLEQALARAPGSAPLLVARAEARRDDPTLSERIARARADADLEAALAADPGDAAALLGRAELAQAGERLEDAAALVEALPEAEAARPRALLARARMARARGLLARAEQLADEARRTGGDCASLELLLDLATRRDALARQDELAASLARCAGGRERLFEHRRRRGDAAGALAIATELARAGPARLDARFARAAALAEVGDPRAAAEELATLAGLWPRDARIEKRRAEYLEMGGDAAGARAARARALLLDGGDLALRRAVALEGGKEPLADMDEDGLAAIAAYRAARPGYATSSVTVLDLGALEAHPGGAVTERVHTVVEARDQRAVERVGEVAIPEGAELLVARTIKRDGRILEPEDPVGDKRTLSLTGLEPGDFAEWTWLRTSPARGPALPGFTGDAFYFRGDTPLWRSIYTAAAPAPLGLEVDAHGMPPPALVQERGRTVLRVLRRDVPPLLAEPNGPGEAEQLPFVQVGAGARPIAVARTMADGLREAFRVSREVRALADDIAAAVPPGERGGDALVRAAYRRVDELVLGGGGPLQEPAGSILSRGRGNRTTLLKAVLDALGVKARLALVRDFTRDPAPYRFPRSELYGYAVLRVERGGRVLWLDPGARGTPFGALPGPVQDAEALVLPEPGEDVVVARTPSDPGERRTTRLRAALDEAGGATVEGAEEYRGFEAAVLRGSLERLDPQARRQAVEQALSHSFRNPALLDFDVDGSSPDGPLVLRWRARVERWARLEEGRAVVDAPLLPARLGARFLRRATRETPLLLVADDRSALELVVVPPAGWLPVPDACEVTTPFGRFRRAERAEQGRLVRQDAYEVARGRIPPPRYGEFARFARAVDEAQERPMVFQRPRGGAGPTAPGP